LYVVTPYEVLLLFFVLYAVTLTLFLLDRVRAQYDPTHF
jgi:hypothetical protein